MKKKVLGLALASVMMVGGVVGAATAYQTFTATQRPDIKVIMDGKTQEFKDANGNTVHPVIINGTTYLPLRPIAGLMGKDVHWNNETQTITLGEPEPTSFVDVAELKPNIASPDVIKVKGEQNLTFDNIGDIGVKYQTAVVFKDAGGFGSKDIDVVLNSSYNKLSCSLLYTIDGNMKITDKDTGITILEKDVKANQIVEIKDIDIKGVKTMNFEVESDNWDEYGAAYFLNPIVE